SLIGLLLTTATPALGQFPTTPPPAGALRPFTLPAPQEASLPNGLKLIVVERHDAPVFSAVLTLAAGSKRDPAGREGLTTLLAEVLTRGTTAHSADQIASQVESLGGTIAAEADEDFLSVSTAGLAESAAPLLALAGEVVQSPSFPAVQFDSAKQRYLVSL